MPSHNAYLANEEGEDEQEGIEVGRQGPLEGCGQAKERTDQELPHYRGQGEDHDGLPPGRVRARLALV